MPHHDHQPDPFAARASLGPGLPDYFRLTAVGDRLDLDRAPVTLKILVENVLRHAGRGIVRPEEVETLASWRPGVAAEAEVPFMPARVILQDFTGVPAVVDLAVMRDAMADLGGDPSKVNPLVPADLVIDHSVQVDRFGTPAAFAFNVEREYERNGERYQLLRWAQTAFRDFRVVPPGTGIVHQVNLEYLATVVTDAADPDGGSGRIAYPDTLVGTDSHTTMINALGVLGYGVGGIEAEAVLLGQPLYQPMPRIVGVRLHGELPQGSTATDLVLVVTEMLRAFGVVGAFVEFAGDGLAGLSLADRATISNMSPEFGATSTIFPIDDETLAYLRLTGRTEERIALVERYAREQGLWREPGDGPDFDALLELDLATVVPSVAGPRRPQDRVAARRACATTSGRRSRTGSRRSTRPASRAGGRRARSTRRARSPSRPATRRRSLRPSPSPRTRRRRRSRGKPSPPAGDGRSYRPIEIKVGGQTATIRTGSVAIAAITSCTNTSNPTVMVGAGLAGTERGRARAPRRTDGQDLARPGLEGRDRLSRGRRAHGAARDARVRPRRLRLHDLHRQLRAARRAGRGRGRIRTISSSRPYCPATATSRDGSIRSPAPATSPRRRSSSPSPSRAGSTSTCSASRSGRPPTARRCSSPTSGPTRPRSAP